MTEISIEGKLGRELGSHWKLKVRNFVELFNALEANTNKLRKYLDGHRREYWAIFVNDERVDPSSFLHSNIKNKKIKIIPILAGAAASVAVAIVGAMGIESALLVMVLEFVLTAIISTAISFGLSLLLAKLLKTDDPKAVNTTSFIFSSPENVTQQGQVVPVGYGRIKVGSTTISVGLTNVDKYIWEHNDMANMMGGTVDNAPPEIVYQGGFTAGWPLHDWNGPVGVRWHT
jgi:predicted phage tail protein